MGFCNVNKRAPKFSMGDLLTPVLKELLQQRPVPWSISDKRESCDVVDCKGVVVAKDVSSQLAFAITQWARDFDASKGEQKSEDRSSAKKK